jgi:hypothetical protein
MLDQAGHAHGREVALNAPLSESDVRSLIGRRRRNGLGPHVHRRDARSTPHLMKNPPPVI